MAAKYKVGDVLRASGAGAKRTILAVGNKKYFYRNDYGEEYTAAHYIFDDNVDWIKVLPFFEKGKQYKRTYPGLTTYTIAEVYERGDSRIAVAWWEDNHGERGVTSLLPGQFNEFVKVDDE